MKWRKIPRKFLVFEWFFVRNKKTTTTVTATTITKHMSYRRNFQKKKLIFRRIETHWFWFYSSYRKGDRQVIMLTERTIPDKTVYTIYLKNAPSKRNGIVFVAVFCCCCCCLFFSVFLLVISCVYPSVVQAEKFENAFESGNRGKCETHEPHQTEDRDKEEEIEKRNEKHSENTEQQYQ